MAEWVGWLESSTGGNVVDKTEPRWHHRTVQGAVTPTSDGSTGHSWTLPDSGALAIISEGLPHICIPQPSSKSPADAAGGLNCQGTAGGNIRPSGLGSLYWNSLEREVRVGKMRKAHFAW